MAHHGIFTASKGYSFMKLRGNPWRSTDLHGSSMALIDSVGATFDDRDAVVDMVGAAPQPLVYTFTKHYEVL